MGWIFCGLIILSSILYWPDPSMGFVLDGDYVIGRNPILHHPEQWYQVFQIGLFDAHKAHPQLTFAYYRPILMLSYFWDAFWFHDKAFGYRLTNCVLHAVNACLLMRLMVNLGLKKSLSLLAALIFIILPVQEWVVNYVVGRGDILHVFFGLLSLLCLHKAKSNNQIRSAWFCAVFILLGLLSREASLMSLIWLWGLLWYLKSSRREMIRFLLPSIILSGIYLGMRQWFLPLGHSWAWEQLPDGFMNAFELTSRLIAPYSLLSKISHHWIFTAALIVIIAGLLFVAKAYEMVKLKQQRVLILGGVFIIASWIPIFIAGSVVERIGPYLSEHFLYPATVGFSLSLAVFFHYINPSLYRRAAVVLFFLGCVLTVVLNNGMWRSEERLLKHVVSLEGDGYVSFRQLHMRYIEDEKAVYRILNTVEEPRMKSVWLKRLGNIKRMQGQRLEAIDQFQQALKWNPNNLEALNEMAVTFLESGDFAKGEAFLLDSLRRDPAYPETYRLLATAYYFNQQFDKCIPLYQQFLSYQPRNTDSQLKLAMAYHLLNRRSEFLSQLNEAFKFHPTQKVWEEVVRELRRNGREQDLRFLQSQMIN